MAVIRTGTQEVYELAEASDVGTVRRRFATLAAAVHLDEARTSDASIIATELATNAIRHGGGGGALIACVRSEASMFDPARETEHDAIAIAVWDRGPGMNVAACLPDGVSSRGSAGGGLGAIARLSSAWDAYARTGGTVVTAVVAPRPSSRPRGPFAIGGVCVPYPGLTVSGDAWDARTDGDVATLIVCDGLGHGDGAADAAKAVLAAFRAARADASPSAIVDACHRAARPTRGAAGTVARLDRARRTVTIAGVGNVVPWLAGDAQKQIVTQHGTLGQVAPTIREETVAWAAGAALVVHSDGLKSRWDLSAHPGLLAHEPQTAAAVLWRDLARGRDDATVVVAREAA